MTIKTLDVTKLDNRSLDGGDIHYFFNKIRTISKELEYRDMKDISHNNLINLIQVLNDLLALPDDIRYNYRMETLLTKFDRVNVLYATSNHDKLNIINRYLLSHPIGKLMNKIFDVTAIEGLPEVEEGVTSLEANARLKATSALTVLGKTNGYIIGDDTGFTNLALSKLNPSLPMQFPGVISKRLNSVLKERITELLQEESIEEARLLMGKISTSNINTKNCVNILILLRLLMQEYLKEFQRDYSGNNYIDRAAFIKEVSNIFPSKTVFFPSKSYIKLLSSTTTVDDLYDLVDLTYFEDSILEVRLCAVNSLTRKEITSVGSIRENINLAKFSLTSNNINEIANYLEDSVGYNKLFDSLDVDVLLQDTFSIDDVYNEVVYRSPNNEAITGMFIGILKDFYQTLVDNY